MQGKIYYPAVFTPDYKDGGYTVCFPDLDGCFTEGDSLAEALDMAEDALGLWLYMGKVDGDVIKPPSDLRQVAHQPDEIVSLIGYDEEEYLRRTNPNRLIKTTVKLPIWLNKAAFDSELDFDALYQKTVLEALNITAQPA